MKKKRVNPHRRPATMADSVSQGYVSLDDLIRELEEHDITLSSE